MKPPRILIVGKDARTDAIAAACAASPQRPEIFAFAEMAAPGLVEKSRGKIEIGSLTDTSVLRGVVERARPDLVIIGPEEPLEAGYVDVLRDMGVPAFGPSQALARVESSKSWTRQLVESHHIPGNPDYRTFASEVGLRDYLDELGEFVIKPDGLTAGKGVRVSGDHFQTIDEAMTYALEVLTADGLVHIEEKLVGQEFSLQTITDGETHIHCPLVQDHKRSLDGDRGPNTGGMGSYSCADFSLPFLTDDDVADARAINEQVIEALAKETGEPYRGVLYGGFMATRDGVRLIEYNCRFGDPEAMNVIPLLEADFVELCAAVAAGELASVRWSFKQKATVCKYVVPEAYPAKSESHAEIRVPEQYREADSDAQWYWAACRLEGDTVYLTSSRSGAIVAIGDTLADAEQLASRAVSEIGGPVRYRKDIGTAGAIASRVDHMDALRRSAVRT